MNNQTASIATQLITTIAVLIGLGFVIWELQQTRTLARAQLSSDGWAETSADKRVMLGENFADTFAKRCRES